MKKIALAGGAAALVDEEDYEQVNRHAWRLYQRGNNSYALAYPNEHDVGCRVWMHRLVMGAKPGQLVDHIDGNGLNNQRSNLRVCSNAENQRNRGKPKTRAAISSRFKGVTWHGGKWRAKIVVDGKQRHLGRFVDEVEAAKAYDAAARKHYGRYAWMNSDDKSVANRTTNEENLMAATDEPANAGHLRIRNEDLAAQEDAQRLHEWKERPYRELFGIAYPTDDEINSYMQRRD